MDTSETITRDEAQAQFEKELLARNAEIERVRNILDRKETDRDVFVSAWNRIFPVLFKEHSPARPHVQLAIQGGTTLDNKEFVVRNVLQEIGRFTVNRVILEKLDDPQLPSAEIARVTARLRARGILVKHPLAESDNKNHFAIGLPEWISPDGEVYPQREYERADKLAKRLPPSIPAGVIPASIDDDLDLE